jgi:transcriptional regulator with XRE-family HTH domain
MADVDVWFGKQIRDLRRTRKLTQARLAKKLELDRVTYTNIENGKQRVTLAHAIALAGELDFSLDEFARKTLNASKRVLRGQPKSVHSVIDGIRMKIRNANEENGNQ